MDCSLNQEDAPAGFTPGQGFVTYNTELVKQERDEDAYISELKLTANEALEQFCLPEARATTQPTLPPAAELRPSPPR